MNPSKLKSLSKDDTGFIPDGRPLIKFDAQRFSRLTGAIYDVLFPHLSSQQPDTRFWGFAGEWTRFDKAQKINREAAIKSTKMGLGQIPGEDFERCGCASVEDFFKKNFESTDVQLDLLLKWTSSL